MSQDYLKVEEIVTGLEACLFRDFTLNQVSLADCITRVSNWTSLARGFRDEGWDFRKLMKGTNYKNNVAYKTLLSCML